MAAPEGRVDRIGRLDITSIIRDRYFLKIVSYLFADKDMEDDSFTSRMRNDHGYP